MFKTFVFDLFCLFALSSCTGSPSCPKNVNITDCLNPGFNIKECFCTCLEVTQSNKHRYLLHITFDKCLQHIKSCKEYQIGFKIQIYLTEDHSNNDIAESDVPIAEGVKWIHHFKNGFMDYNLEAILKGKELERCKSYKLMIQPQCTLCEFCRNLPDINIPALDTCNQLSEENTQPPGTLNPLNNVLFVTSLSICVMTVIGTIVFFIRRHLNQMHTFQNMHSSLSIDIGDTQKGEDRAIIVTYHAEV